MTRTIYRYRVPVDGEWHEIESGPALHVACRELTLVEFWAHPSSENVVPRKYRVYSTGEVIEDNVQYVGTALAPGGNLVWHLMTK